MAIQLAHRGPISARTSARSRTPPLCGPHPDLQSAKIGPRSTVGPEFRTSHVFGRKLIVCLMHVERANFHQIVGKTFSIFGPQITVKTFSGPNEFSSSVS